ncbi:hypothetical protein LTR82_018402, partial [Friedmanniomyces endolithicus]
VLPPAIRKRISGLPTGRLHWSVIQTKRPKILRVKTVPKNVSSNWRKHIAF